MGCCRFSSVGGFFLLSLLSFLSLFPSYSLTRSASLFLLAIPKDRSSQFFTPTLLSSIPSSPRLASPALLLVIVVEGKRASCKEEQGIAVVSPRSEEKAALDAVCTFRTLSPLAERQASNAGWSTERRKLHVKTRRRYGENARTKKTTTREARGEGYGCTDEN